MPPRTGQDESFPDGKGTNRPFWSLRLQDDQWPGLVPEIPFP